MEINLNHGMVALIDDEMWNRVKYFTWRVQNIPTKQSDCFYATASVRYNGRKFTIYMHNLIMGMPEHGLIDHKDGNTLDNRIENLRIASKSQNGMNIRKRQHTSSKFKGVCFSGRDNSYRAYINVRGKQISLGYSKSEKECALAYNNAARQYFGEYAKLNIV